MTEPGIVTTGRIEIKKDVNANITLAGVNIDTASMINTAAFKIEDDSKGMVTITLAKGTTNNLHIRRNRGSECKTLREYEAEGKAIIQGTGELDEHVEEETESVIIAGSFEIEGAGITEGTDFTYENSVLTIKTNTPMDNKEC